MIIITLSILFFPKLSQAFCVFISLYFFCYFIMYSLLVAVLVIISDEDVICFVCFTLKRKTLTSTAGLSLSFDSCDHL